MIRYTCDSCRASLETDESLSGKVENCPACGHPNPVPLPRAVERRLRREGKALDRELIEKRRQEESARQAEARRILVQEEAEKQQQYLAAVAQAKANPETPKTWYCLREGQERGPMREAMLQEWLDEGQLSPQDRVRPEGGSSWIWLYDIPERFHIPVMKSGTPVQEGLVCQHCGGSMKRATLSSGNCLGILLALIVLFSGLFIAVFFFLTLIGPIIGALMMLAALFMGGRRRRVWKCRHCGYIFDRA